MDDLGGNRPALLRLGDEVALGTQRAVNRDRCTIPHPPTETIPLLTHQHFCLCALPARDQILFLRPSAHHC